MIFSIILIVAALVVLLITFAAGLKMLGQRKRILSTPRHSAASQTEGPSAMEGIALPLMFSEMSIKNNEKVFVIGNRTSDIEAIREASGGEKISTVRALYSNGTEKGSELYVNAGDMGSTTRYLAKYGIGYLLGGSIATALLLGIAAVAAL